MKGIPQLFASNVFDDEVMKERLPKETYKALKKTTQDGKPLDITVANVVANAMKDWAIEKGVTHFTHWFQPMTGVTAEKHDSFISPTSDGKIIMEFKGKELIKGEPDASSFPSGGLRATFEARGYTAWDPTSYAFIKDGILCIPTAFCSYTGECLDKKTPLLRSMEAINKQALRILKLFGRDEVESVKTTVGPEQEYFLITEEDYRARPDIILTGRTLFGSMPPKGQEMDDHYFGAVKPRVVEYMKELDEELWKLGVLAKTKHNEVAPSQHELAPIFATTNVAVDHNQITMEIAKKVARKHGLRCLLHEKPFDGVNGSGKHNNWSISTNTGMNLLEPGSSPEDNAQFLLFLTAVIKAVDEYQDMLRLSIATAGNDHRLGANEAPPAIVSVFLGDVLSAILQSISEGTPYEGTKALDMEIGVDVLPHFPKDATDRNRTSPFAFTGNRFEFRMLGSSASVATPNIVLNTAVAQVLKEFADVLEKEEDFTEGLNKLLKTTLKDHGRIVFNGNNYSDEWVEEAARRGLSNHKTTVDVLPTFLEDKNINMFESNGVFTRAEIESRYEILMETYCKTVHIEALTMIEMVKRDIVPAVLKYVGALSEGVSLKKAAVPGATSSVEELLVEKLSRLCSEAYEKTEALDAAVKYAEGMEDATKMGCYYRDTILTLMAELRAAVDLMEQDMGTKDWPYPSYGKILFSV